MRERGNLTTWPEALDPATPESSNGYLSYLDNKFFLSNPFELGSVPVIIGLLPNMPLRGSSPDLNGSIPEMCAPHRAHTLDWERPNSATLMVTSSPNPVEDEDCFTMFKTPRKAPQKSTCPFSVPSEMKKMHKEFSKPFK